MFPDVVAAVCEFLADELQDRAVTAAVGTVVPRPRPEQLVRVRRIAGARRNLVVDSPQLSVECWAASEEAAHDLAQLVRALVHSMRGGTVGSTVIYHVAEIGGPALLPDGETDTPRFVATYEIGTRGRAA